AQVKAGQNVLVYGASGGVGNYVMQILLAKGAKVTAVCSTRNVAYAKKLGCQQVIDYKTEDFTQLSQRFDVILGINGCQPMAVYQKLLRPDGIFVGVGNSK
ncbi:zinc-binding dehydrogenase, partial [Streptococcus suis]